MALGSKLPPWVISTTARASVTSRTMNPKSPYSLHPHSLQSPGHLHLGTPQEPHSLSSSPVLVLVHGTYLLSKPNLNANSRSTVALPTYVSKTEILILPNSSLAFPIQQPHRCSSQHSRDHPCSSLFCILHI